MIAVGSPTQLICEPIRMLALSTNVPSPGTSGPQD